MMTKCDIGSTQGSILLSKENSIIPSLLALMCPDLQDDRQR